MLARQLQKVSRRFGSHRLLSKGVGYGASLCGVAGLTWVIGLLFPRHHIANISMIYLLLVLALAVFAGSGPAILASVLAFLSFDWFFVPPVGHWNVANPAEWLALFLFLVVATISGQLAEVSAVRQARPGEGPAKRRCSTR